MPPNQTGDLSGASYFRTRLTRCRGADASAMPHSDATIAKPAAIAISLVIFMLGIRFRSRFEDLDGAPAAPDEKPPRADVPNGLHDAPVAVEERRIYRILHE